MISAMGTSIVSISWDPPESSSDPQSMPESSSCRSKRASLDRLPAARGPAPRRIRHGGEEARQRRSPAARRLACAAAALTLSRRTAAPPRSLACPATRASDAPDEKPPRAGPHPPSAASLHRTTRSFPAAPHVLHIDRAPPDARHRAPRPCAPRRSPQRLRTCAGRNGRHCRPCGTPRRTATSWLRGCSCYHGHRTAVAVPWLGSTREKGCRLPDDQRDDTGVGRI